QWRLLRLQPQHVHCAVGVGGEEVSAVGSEGQVGGWKREVPSGLSFAGQVEQRDVARNVLTAETERRGELLIVGSERHRLPIAGLMPQTFGLVAVELPEAQAGMGRDGDAGAVACQGERIDWGVRIIMDAEAG